jgi:hypothetical protein
MNDGERRRGKNGCICRIEERKGCGANSQKPEHATQESHRKASVPHPRLLLFQDLQFTRGEQGIIMIS